MQIKIAITYYLTPVRMAVIKKMKKVNVGEYVEKRKCLLHKMNKFWKSNV
jgi:hypothetical protein